MFYRLLCILVTGSVIAASGAAAYLYWSPASEPVGLVVEEPEQELHNPLVGRWHAVRFRVVNPTGQAHRIIGVGFV
jgi:hypothetical protein